MTEDPHEVMLGLQARGPLVVEEDLWKTFMKEEEEEEEEEEGWIERMEEECLKTFI